MLEKRVIQCVPIYINKLTSPGDLPGVPDGTLGGPLSSETIRSSITVECYCAVTEGRLVIRALK